MNNKYGSILTMILVILIVAILGILGYFVYSFFYAQSINNNANSGLEEFKDAITSVNKNPIDNTISNTVEEPSETPKEENKVNTELIDPSELINSGNQNNQNLTTPEEPKEDNRVMMEDYEIIGSIKIPKTGIELPILDEVEKRSLELSVGVAYGPGLNQPGNTIIFGHNYRNDLFFSNNKKITNGDKIYITDKQNNTVTYIVFSVFETSQYDSDYMQREVAEGVREISLQTCTDDSKGRIIVCAREQRKIDNK